jgi:hypothetical protein
MGSEFNFHKLRALDKNSAREEGRELIAQAKYDHGHAGYSGSFAECDGVAFAPDYVSLTDEAKVEEWLWVNARKWGPMVIVQDEAGVFYAGAMCSS